MEQPSEGAVDIYGGKDPRLLPAYSVGYAARHLHLPSSTVRAWVLGRRYHTVAGPKVAAAVIDIVAPATGDLSFLNLVEVHVLSAIRRHHRIKLEAIRQAVRYLEKELSTEHPLAQAKMLTDGKDLFVEHYGKLINISAQGQLAMKEVLELYLRRIERDSEGLPVRLFPFSTVDSQDDQRPVSINPRVQFGRPCIAGTRIPTSVVAGRHLAGETIEELAYDYDCSGDQIEAAIRYECRQAA